MKIGSGAYGTVYKGELKRDGGLPVAVKRLDYEEQTEQGLIDMMKEARVMQLYDHPNVVHFYGYIIDRPPYLLVMEFCKVRIDILQIVEQYYVPKSQQEY